MASRETFFTLSGVIETRLAGWSPFITLLNNSCPRNPGIERCWASCAAVRALYLVSSLSGNAGWRITSAARSISVPKCSVSAEPVTVASSDDMPAPTPNDAAIVSSCSEICVVLRVGVPSRIIDAVTLASPVLPAGS